MITIKQLAGIVLAVACLASSTFAQNNKVTRAFSSASGERTVNILVKNTSLSIESHSGNEVIIESDVTNEVPERAKGLKALSAMGTDNTGIGLGISESGNTIKIVKVMNQDATYTMKIPKTANLIIHEEGWEGSEFKIVGIEGEIEIESKGANIHVEKISGPITAHSVSGDITVVYSGVKPDKPSSITATSGYIDVTLPATAKVNLNLRSMSGEIYSDMTLDVPQKEGMTTYTSNGITGKLNGGGTEITLKATSDDIFLRKAKSE